MNDTVTTAAYKITRRKNGSDKKKEHPQRKRRLYSRPAGKIEIQKEKEKKKSIVRPSANARIVGSNRDPGIERPKKHEFWTPYNTFL